MTTDRDQATRDRLAEAAWGVLVAAGVDNPSVIAHAIVGNQLPVVADNPDATTWTPPAGTKEGTR